MIMVQFCTTRIFPSKKANNIDYLKSQLEIMKESHEPIVFEYADGKYNKIYKDLFY